MGAAVAAIVVLLPGCNPPDEEPAADFAPKPVAFVGKPDPKYLGDWVASGGASRLKLQRDGTAVVETTSHSQAGTSTVHYDGKWLADGKALLIQYSDSSGPITLKYDATLRGNHLILQQPGGRIKTDYLKK